MTRFDQLNIAGAELNERGVTPAQATARCGRSQASYDHGGAEFTEFDFLDKKLFSAYSASQRSNLWLIRPLADLQ